MYMYIYVCTFICACIYFFYYVLLVSHSFSIPICFFFIGYHTFIIHFFTCSSGPQNRLSQKHTVLVLDLEVYKKTQTVLYKELLKLRYTSKSTVLAVKFGGLGTILWRS